MTLSPAGLVSNLAADAWRARAEEFAGRGGESPGTGIPWHLQEALRCAAAEDWEAARWHLDRQLQADTNDWRAYVRRTKAHVAEGRLDAAAADLARAFDLGPGDTVLLWYRLFQREAADTRQAQTALWYLDRLLAARPKEASLHASRAELLTRQGQWQEAAEEYARAAGLKPHDAQLWLESGRAYVQAERWEQAVAVLSKGIDLAPDHAGLFRERAGLYVRRGRWDEAAADYVRALELTPAAGDPWWSEGDGIEDEIARSDEAFARVVKLRPRDRRLWIARVLRFATHGQWQDAATALARVIELDPSDHFAWYGEAPVRLQLGDVEGYRRACREMLARFGHTDNPNIAERTAKTCLLAPDAVGTLEPVLRLADQALIGTEGRDNYRWYLLDGGLADYRAGRFAAAVARLRKSLSPAAPTMYLDATADVVLALAQQRLGQADEAKQALADARELEQRFPKVGSLGASWHDWLRYHLLRREAEALLGGAEPGPMK